MNFCMRLYITSKCPLVRRRTVSHDKVACFRTAKPSYGRTHNRLGHEHTMRGMRLTYRDPSKPCQGNDLIIRLEHQVLAKDGHDGIEPPLCRLKLQGLGLEG